MLKTGTGTLVLSGLNSFSGATTINAGTLQAGAPAVAFGSTSAVSVASGATLALAGYAERVGSLAGAGTVNLTNGTLVVGGDNSTQIFSGSLTDGGSGGLGSVVKMGNGSLVLANGSNPFVGNLSVGKGTVVLTGANSAGAGSGTVYVGGDSNAAGGTILVSSPNAGFGGFGLNAGTTASARPASRKRSALKPRTKR